MKVIAQLARNTLTARRLRCQAEIGSLRSSNQFEDIQTERVGYVKMAGLDGPSFRIRTHSLLRVALHDAFAIKRKSEPGASVGMAAPIGSLVETFFTDL